MGKKFDVLTDHMFRKLPIKNKLSEIYTSTLMTGVYKVDFDFDNKEH